MNKISAIFTVICGLLILPACKKNADKPLTDLSIGRSKDLTLAAELETPNEFSFSPSSPRSSTQHAVIKLKGDKARTDFESLGISTIQAASGGIFLLNHETKTIQRQNTEPPDTSAMSKDDAAKLSNAFAMRFTGKTEKIAGWDTREFLVIDLTDGVPVSDQFRMAAWIADDFPEGRDIQRLLERVAPNQALAFVKKATGKTFALPGFALRTEFRRGGNEVMKVTFTAIRQGELPASDFELPKDYLQGLSK